MSTVYARFITTNYLFTRKILDPNIDVDLINMRIDDAQNINIQQVLGYGLYTKLMTDIFTTNTTTGVYYDLLVNYVQIAHARWVLFRMPEFINYRLTNKSVMEKHSDNANPTSQANIFHMKNDLRSDAEFYTQRVREFIMNNQSALPEYNNNLTRIGALKPRSNNYFGGVYLPKYPKGRISPQFGDPDCCDGY